MANSRAVIDDDCVLLAGTPASERRDLIALFLARPGDGTGPSFHPVALGVLSRKARLDMISIRSPRRALSYGERRGTYQPLDVEICRTIRSQPAVNLQPAGLARSAFLPV